MVFADDPQGEHTHYDDGPGQHHQGEQAGYIVRSVEGASGLAERALWRRRRGEYFFGPVTGRVTRSRPVNAT